MPFTRHCWINEPTILFVKKCALTVNGSIWSDRFPPPPSKLTVVILLLFLSSAIRRKSLSYKTGRDLPQAPKAGMRSSLKGRTPAQKHWPLFELVVWVFFSSSVSDRKITLCHSVPSIFVSISGEFNLWGVGGDTRVINQPRACVCKCCFVFVW